MEGYGRRILVAVEPGLLQGALATLLSGRGDDDVVEVGGAGLEGLDRSSWDAAIVSDELPASVQAEVVITLPDTRGSGGTGTVRSGEAIRDVTISGAQGIVELLERYSPRRQ